jgi:hypothetical protein
MGHDPTASHAVWHGICGRAGGRGQGCRAELGQGCRAELGHGAPMDGASALGHGTAGILFSMFVVKLSCLYRIL